MSYLGIDIGTSGVKAVLFNEDGVNLGGAYRPYSLKTDESGAAELDSLLVMSLACEVIAEAASHACGDPVKALCVSSQGEAVTPLGADGEYLANAMVSSDRRPAPFVDLFTEQFGLEKLYRITGHTPSTLFTLFKILWMKEKRPEVWKKTRRLYCFEDLLHQGLGMSPAMGWPLAGRTMLFDVSKHSWSPEILDALGLDESFLARPLPSGSVAGIIPDKIAASLGLPSGVKVVCGGHDQIIGALGAGVIEESTAMYAAGTVECICPVFSTLTLNSQLCKRNLCSYDYAMEGRYSSVAYSLTGSNLFQYFKEELGGGRSYAELLNEMPESPSKLLALPYFTPSGTPYFDGTTPGAILGLRLTSSRGEILKALLESVALEMRLNLSIMEEAGMKITRLIATGGGVRDRMAVQLKADVIGKTIETIDVREAGCLGAARLAQSADQGVPVMELVRRERNAENEIHPSANTQKTYEEKFLQYKILYSEIKNLSDRLWRAS